MPLFNLTFQYCKTFVEVIIMNPFKIPEVYNIFLFIKH